MLLNFYESDRWSKDLYADFFFAAVQLTKNTDLDKCSHSGYCFGFDSCSLFSNPNFDWGKNVVILGVDNSS